MIGKGMTMRKTLGAALFALAPAETSPSAIAAASGIVAPTLIITGSRDCVTPSAAQAGPIPANTLKLANTMAANANATVAAEARMTRPMLAVDMSTEAG